MPSYNAIVPQAGCKRQASKRIVASLGDHNAYWEPFCGSCAILFSKPACRMEVVNDLHEDLINLIRCVKDDACSLLLYESLYKTLFCEQLYQECVADLQKHRETGRKFLPGVEWAYAYFVVSWMGRNGLVGTTNELKTGFCKRFTSNGGDPATRFRHAVENIPTWWQRLRGVTVLSEDGIALCERIEDKPGTVIYVDPPYFTKTLKYKHDFDPEQHQALAEVLRRFKKTKVVLSYYEHPMLEDLYLRHGWRCEALDVNKNMVVATEGAVKAPEVLLTSPHL